MTCKKGLKVFLVLAAVGVVMLLVYMPNGINEYANSFREAKALGGEGLLPIVPVLIFLIRKNFKDMQSVKREFFGNRKE